MKICPYCKAENPAAAERCEKCGAWFSGAEAKSPAQRGGPAPAARELPPADSFEGHILRLLTQNQKIQAIKFYREQTGAGLKQAKDEVEALGRLYGIDVGGSGCASAAMVACFLVGVLAYFVRTLILG